MSDSVGKVFVHALNTVKRIPRTGSARPPSEDRLKLYGLYKQSMEGNVKGVMRRPEGQGVEEKAEREKWDAWSSQHSLSRTEAKRRYISTLISTMHKYASITPEARELVAELEFVWDQIKSNPASSSSSSPHQQALGLSQSQAQQQPSSYTSIGPERATNEGGGALRMIKPISEPDDEDEDLDDYDDAADLRDGNDDSELVPTRANAARIRDYELRNRKWRKRISLALFKMTTEIAALREQLEAKRFVGAPHQRRRGLWAWVLWLTYAAAKHVVVDALLLGIALLWARRKDDRRLEQGLKLLLRFIGEQIRQARLPRFIRLPAQRTQDF